MVRGKPQIYNKIEIIPLPPTIPQHHFNIAMFMDFFYINGNIFTHTKSDKINFLTAK